MVRPLVYGYVGLGAIPAHMQDDRTKTKVLIVLRDYLEEQLEREYDVCAQLTITSEGTLELGAKGNIDETLVADLRAAAERSLREFIALRLNDCLKDLQDVR